MTSILLDTHVLIWLALGENIGSKTRLLITSQAESVYVSTLSILELRVKQAVGKMPNAEEIILSAETMGCTLLDFTASHSMSYGLFSSKNRDPFDNALISVAMHEGLPLVTADRNILSLNHSRLKTLDARQ